MHPTCLVHIGFPACSSASVSVWIEESMVLSIIISYKDAHACKQTNIRYLYTIMANVGIRNSDPNSPIAKWPAC